MLKQVPSFQTSDGKLFPDKVEALTYEQRLELAGLLRSSRKDNRSENFMTSEVVNFLVANQDEIQEISKRYKNQITRIRAARTKVGVA